MGVKQEHEVLEDFIFEMQKAGIKKAFFTVRMTESKLAQPEGAARLAYFTMLSACDPEGKVQLLHTQASGTYDLLPGKPPEEYQKFAESVKANVDGVVREIQAAFPAATVYAGAAGPI